MTSDDWRLATDDCSKEKAMIRKLSEPQREAGGSSSRPRRMMSGLQVALWILWTLAVASGGYLGWRTDTLADRPMNLLGMAISVSTISPITPTMLALIE